MAYVVRINGVTLDEADHPVEQFNVSEVMNGINRCDFRVPIVDDDLVIEVGQTVEVEKDSVLAFGGYIDEIREKTINWTNAKSLAITATDFSQIGQFRLVNLTLAVGTLKDQLFQLETPYLDDYGASVDPAQPDGPMMPETPIVDLYVRDVLNILAKNAPGYGWQFSYDRKLSMTPTASTAAPFAITPANVADKVLGDVLVQKKRNEGYANRVIIRSPPVDRIEYDETFPPADGVQDTWTLTGHVTRMYGYVRNGDDPANPGQPLYERLALAPATDAEWQFDSTTNDITRLAGSPTVGNIVVVKYDGQFSGSAMAEDVPSQAPPTGIREILLLAPEGLSDEALQGLAEAELAARKQNVIRVAYKTNEEGVRPGQTQPVEETHHAIDGQILVTEVGIADEKLGGGLTRNVQGTLADRFQGSFRDKFTLWAQAGRGAATAQTTEGVSNLGPCPPQRAVQVFKDGQLYADSDHLSDFDGGGPTYFGFPSRVSIRARDEATANLALVGPDGSFVTIQVYNTGDVYFKGGGASGGDWSLQPVRDFAVAAGRKQTFDVGSHVTDGIFLRALTGVLGLAIGLIRVTATTYTIDATIGSGGSPATGFIFDPTAAATITLPLLTSFQVNPASGQYRVLLLINDSPTYNVTFNGNGSDTIFVRGVGQPTLVLPPGSSALLVGLTGTDAGWKIASSDGSVGSSSGGVQTATVTLSNAQIKALPTTPVTVIAAPAAGYRNRILAVSYSSNCAAGVYTGFNATYVDISLLCGGNYLAYGPVNDSTTTPALAVVSALLGTTTPVVLDVNTPSLAAFGASQGYVQNVNVNSHSTVSAAAVSVAMDNNGSGVLGGGNAANTLKVTVSYQVEAL